MNRAWTRRDFIAALEMLAANGLLPEAGHALILQATENSGPGSSDEQDTLNAAMADALNQIFNFVGSAVQQVNSSSPSDTTSIPTSSPSTMLLGETFGGESDFILSLGVEETVGNSGQVLAVTEGLVAGYNDGLGQLRVGPFITVSHEASSSLSPQGSVGLAGSYGRGDVLDGFYGRSNTGVVNANVGDAAGSLGFTYNNAYQGVSASVATSLPGPPSYSFSIDSETYGESAVLTIDGYSIEDVYNALLRSSQDPLMQFFNSAFPY
jgi:hypothetical protein